MVTVKSKLAHQGTRAVVAKRGKPRLWAISPSKSTIFVGAAKAGKPLTASFLEPAITREDWKAGR